MINSETKEYLLCRWNDCAKGHSVCNPCVTVSQEVFSKDTQCLDSRAGLNQQCPAEMGMISHMEVVSGIVTVGSVAPAFLRGSRPLAVFTGVSVQYVAWLPTFLCLSPHNGECLQHSSVCVRCLRRSQALANLSSRPRGWHCVQQIRMDTLECFPRTPVIHIPIHSVNLQHD